MGAVPCAAKEILCGSAAADCIHQGLELIQLALREGHAISDEDNYYIISCYDQAEALADKANARILKAIGWDSIKYEAYLKTRGAK